MDQLSCSMKRIRAMPIAMQVNDVAALRACLPYVPFAIEPIFAERDGLASTRHEDSIGVSAAYQVAKEIAHHPVVPKMIALTI